MKEKVSLLVGHMASKMQPVNIIFEIGAETNLICEALLVAKWLMSIRPNNGPTFKNVTNQKVGAVGH